MRSRHGAVVGINCFPSSAMRAAADELAAEVAGHGGRALVLPADITDRRGVVEMFEKCEKDLGPIDVLITNAADLGDTPWDDLDLAGWESMLRVNSTGTFLCAQSATKMRARAGGVIITVSSATVELGHGASVPYIASKGAVIAFTRALAHVAGPHNIRVNSVMPGAIGTETTLEVSRPGAREALLEKQCLLRGGVQTTSRERSSSSRHRRPASSRGR